MALATAVGGGTVHDATLLEQNALCTCCSLSWPWPQSLVSFVNVKLCQTLLTSTKASCHAPRLYSVGIANAAQVMPAKVPTVKLQWCTTLCKLQHTAHGV